MPWRTSPAATELEQLVARLARAAARPAARPGTGTSRTPPRRRRSPRSPRRATRRPERRRLASEHANFSVEKAARILGLEFRTVPVDDEFRMRPELLARRRDRGRRDRRHDLVDVGRPGARARRPLRARPASGCTSTRPTPARRRSARSSAGASTASTAPTRSSSTRTSGSSRRSTARRSGRAVPRTLHAAFSAHARLPRVRARRARPARLRPGARPPLPRAQALDGAALLRPRGPAGADPRARPPGGAVRGVGARRARLGGRRRRGTSRRSASGTARADNDEIARAATATGEIFVATTKLRGESVIRLAIGNARTQEDDVRVAWEVLRECAR